MLTSDIIGATNKRVGRTVFPIGTPKKSPSDEGYFWAGDTIRFEEEACRHFITVGATGSGKSITLNLLMKSVLLKIGSNDGIQRRALVYDSKSDLVSFLAGVLPGGMKKIRILNPLDARFTPWDMASDITTETDASEFASILIPKNPTESSPYFTDAARSLVAGVINRLNATENGKSPKLWSLRDIIVAFESKGGLETFLDHPVTAHLLDHFEESNSKNFAGVKSSVDTVLSMYRPIAALFEASKTNEDGTPKKPFSLRRWLDEDSILVLGNSEDAREATDTLNRMMFRQLSKFIIGREGRIKENETWIFLDELREAGDLPGLRQLLLRGRSKGVAVALGFQDVEGIYDAYGDHAGAEIIGAAQNVIILHLNPTATRTTEWASQVMGAPKEPDVSTSTNRERGGVGGSEGESHSLRVAPNVLPMQFPELPMPSPKSGLEYYAFTEIKNEKLGGYGRGKYDWEFLKKCGVVDLAKVESGAEDFESRKKGSVPPLVNPNWKAKKPDENTEKAKKDESSKKTNASFKNVHRNVDLELEAQGMAKSLQLSGIPTTKKRALEVLTEYQENGGPEAMTNDIAMAKEIAERTNRDWNTVFLERMREETKAHHKMVEVWAARTGRPMSDIHAELARVGMRLKAKLSSEQ